MEAKRARYEAHSERMELVLKFILQGENHEDQAIMASVTFNLEIIYMVSCMRMQPFLPTLLN